MGRGTIGSGLFRSERYGLDLRTTDPVNHNDGEAWIRTDLAPDSDQLATLRFDNGSGVWDIPIYDTAASVNNVKKAQRIQIAGTTGFIPVVEGSGAYDAVRLQHNGAVHSVHDSLDYSAIPDSAIVQFEDGDTAGWVVDRGTGISAVQTTANGGSAYNGDYMGGIETGNGENSTSYYDLEDPISPDNLSVAIRVENQSLTNDRTSCNFALGGTNIINVWLRDSSGMSFNHAYDDWSTNNIGGFSQDTWYNIEFLNIDWNTEVVGSIEVNGSEELTDIGFNSSASSIDRYIQDTSGQSSQDGYSDDWIPS